MHPTCMTETFAFYPASLALILLMRGLQSARDNWIVYEGSPRYLICNLPVGYQGYQPWRLEGSD